ncbi:hypothetical protein C0989_009418 [Termitomyces sp. Mn162]|nr:hypothetical protein C0989_009418 [Termitomyces sp. Mn162]
MRQLATTTSQSISQSATATAALASPPQPQINVTVNSKTNPLPDKYKELKKKATYFLQVCKQYFAEAEVTKDDVEVATALILIKEDKASKWANN